MERPLPLTFYLFVSAGLIAANMHIYDAVFAPKELRVTIFKNAAALVHTPSSKTLLVDTGSDASILRSLGETLPEWQRSIDTVIITSGEGTQAGGLPDVMSRYHATNLIRFGTEGSKTFESALAATASADLQQTTAPYGADLTLDTDTRLTVISPGIFNISYGTVSLSFSSTTPAGDYVLK